MTRNYEAFSQKSFENVLKEVVMFKEVKVEGTNEVVYDCPLPDKNMVIRVYSSLERNRSRSRGSDAIRCVIFDTDKNTVVGGRKLTQRQDGGSNGKGWKLILQDKLRSLYKNWRQYRKTCPKCNSRMALREGEYGNFWGCCNYPQCKNTEQYEKA